MIKRGKNKISKKCVGFLIIIWSFVIIYAILTIATDVFSPPIQANIFKLLGYFKLLISFIKYMP